MPERPRPVDVTLVAPGVPPSGPGVPPSSVPPVSLPPASSERAVLAQRYEILGLLGEGGMGTVYRARDLELDELVALKLLRPEIANDPSILEGFRQEVRLARRVTHPNVARVFDIGEHQGDKLLTMELVDGGSLAAALSRDGAFDPARAIGVASSIASALTAAHAAGVAHRDLKPENVLITRDGRVVVTDFGIARALLDAGAVRDRVGELAGTPAYMAPEQLAGRTTDDVRADLFSFGAVLYEMLAGERAFPGDTVQAILLARLEGPALDLQAHRPDVPARLADLVRRCLAHRPEDRPASAAEVLRELSEMAVAPRPVQAPRAPAGRNERTVAVLPFQNGGAADDAYLAEELTDDLIDALSMTRGLRVRARALVSRHRGEDADPREVGRALGVEVVVLGSVRRARGSVRISARLVSVRDGFQLWAKRLERPEQDMLSINEEVASAVAAALTLDHRRSARDAPRDPVAVDLYLRARHEYRKFWPDHQRRALALFERAEAIAPDDPLILSGLALSHSRLQFFASDVERARARRAAERAAAAAPDTPEPYLAMGAALLQHGEPGAAVRAMRTAVALGPGHAEAHATLGRILLEIGEVDEGMRQLDVALGLDPFVPLACSAQTRAYALLGRWSEADALHALVPEREGWLSYWAIRARAALWRRSAASDFTQQIPRDLERGLLWAMGEVVLTGKVPEELVTFSELARTLEGGPRRKVLFFQMFSEIMAAAGELEQALAAVAAADAQGLLDVFWLDRCPVLDPLREDPRFVAVHASVSERAAEVRRAFAAP